MSNRSGRMAITNVTRDKRTHFQRVNCCMQNIIFSIAISISLVRCHNRALLIVNIILSLVRINTAPAGMDVVLWFQDVSNYIILLSTVEPFSILLIFLSIRKIVSLSDRLNSFVRSQVRYQKGFRGENVSILPIFTQANFTHLVSE